MQEVVLKPGEYSEVQWWEMRVKAAIQRIAELPMVNTISLKRS
jgi:hypothetical protein